MSDTAFNHDPLEIRKRKARFRAWHRGTREADLVVGGFADRGLAGLSEMELDLFEALLEEADADIVKWVTGELPLPAHQDNAIVRRMIDQARSLTT
ncbi:succinate dehydrogenase assembly factor 2 [Aliihoeflea aestuarii]|jgi:antitoxin CptB|uniref:FAD assembly factor SdhE n=1 Tax=Aliihoeflea aestuarii TaxID=453840 RepID=UPI0020928F21|nr:succinate dehydrogenase assembly factor 2 [Aliihoeflea aestuarii]MCO6390338.1 succinate dehydrogenase assembly factor 2 [Aliihoeflea aestuarii]